MPLNEFRVGIDFGYGYSGIALLNDKNDVLDFAVIKHQQLTGDLSTRRQNRSARRSKDSKRKRLRDFKAFLKGMGIEPRGEWRKGGGGKISKSDKKFIGNRLYALAHFRGWDYASISEILADDKGNATPTVRRIDEFLMSSGAPVKRNKRTPKKPKKGADANAVKKFKKDEENCKRAIEVAEHGDATGQPPEIIHWLAAECSCLGIYSETLKKITTLEKKGTSPQLDEAYAQRDAIEGIIEDVDSDQISDWIDERIEACLGKPPQNEKARKDISEYILVMLGLKSGKKLYDEGKLYRPHKNRHREAMLEELHELIDEALADKAIIEKAKVLAQKTGETEAAIKEGWKKQARAIIEHEYRKKRFANRKMKKCAVRTTRGERCGKNVAKRGRGDLRKIVFEAEARQIKSMKGEKRGDDLIERKYTNDEINELLACVDFEAKEKNEIIKEEHWNAFFTFPRNPSVPKENGQETGKSKKEILRDIAAGTMGGRASMCIHHLQKRLELLRRPDGTNTDDWQRINARSEAVLSDAPPSLQQKITRCVKEVEKILGRHGATLENATHFGIESARFDIAALSAAEGRQFKNKVRYQSKRDSNKEELAEEQGGLCFKCGQQLGYNIHTDHLFPKKSGGGNTALNKVAMHDLCNIEKWKHLSLSPDRNVLNNLRQNNPDKAAYIEKRLQNGEFRLPEDMLAGAGQTMFGTKLLRSVLAEKTGRNHDDNELFPHIRAGETAFFRKIWFPHMSFQKWVLRQHQKTGKWPVRIRDSKYGKEGEAIKIDENDSIRKFNHALDAIVIASNIDWGKIARLEQDIDNNARDRNRRRQEAHKTVIPVLDANTACPAGEWNADQNDWQAPPIRDDWYIEDKKNKSKSTVAKTKREPLRLRKIDGQPQVLQRVPLDRLPYKDLDKIRDKKIREAMQAAFTELGITKEKECIPVDWFLKQNEGHCLYHKDVRSTQIIRLHQPSNPKNLHGIKRGEAVHYFGKENPWAVAHVFEYEETGKKGKTKKEAIRETDAFYYRSKATTGKQPLNPRYEKDIPSGARRIASFRKRDWATIDDPQKPGEWQIIKLNSRRAYLKNKAGIETQAVYTKLKPCPGPEK